ncbi:low temperature requirement protein A [Deinococcus sp.]|uniref:low temperature requirement protein A n=1 Tax=Deinococcus sp. TaxID=47478 RepID=UPI003CC5E542
MTAGPLLPASAPVSTLELFLDLVFVFTVTQITGLIAHPSGAAHSLTAPSLTAPYLHALLILLLVWWMYSGYIWLTSNVGTDQAAHRLLMFGGMGGFLMMALGIPHAFGSGGAAFGLGYLLVTLIHAGLFLSAPNSSARAIRGIFGFNLTAALLVLAAAFVPDGWKVPLWTLAVTVLIVSGLLRRESGFQLRPAHFAERHGLILMIALGESVVAIGAGVGNAPLTPPLLLGALLGLALSAALWWSYFGTDAEGAAGALEKLSPLERTRLALRAFGFGHAIMIAGVIGVAAGVKLTLGQLGSHAGLLTAWSLAGGTALYLLGDALFRQLAYLAGAAPRLIFAALALLTAPLGSSLGSLWQLAALLGLLSAMLLVEARRNLSRA